MSAFSSGFSSGFGAALGLVKYWVSASDSDSDIDVNWSLSSGGPSDTIAPETDDTCIFDDGGLGNCNWNKIVSLALCDLFEGYTGTVTLKAGIILGIKGDNTIELGCGLTLVSGAQLDLDGSIIWDAAANIDFQSGSIFNTGGNLLIPTGNDYDMSGTVILAKDGGTVQISNGDNSSRIGQVQLTANSTLEQSPLFYADSVAGPVSGVTNWTGIGAVLSLNPWTNKQNIVCAADIDGGISLSDAFTDTTVGDYGNWVLTGDNKTISGIGDMLCFRFDCFRLSQNATVTTIFIGTINLRCNQGLKITDTNLQENRGGIFRWESSGLLSIGFNGIICNDVDGIQSSEFVSIAGAGPITILGGGISIGANGRIDLGLYSNLITLDGSFIVDGSAISSTVTANLLLNGSNAQVLDVMSQFDGLRILKTAGSVELHEINCGQLLAEAQTDVSYTLNWIAGDTHSIDDIFVVGSGSGLVICQSSIDATQATVSMANNSTVFNTDFKDMNFTGGIVFADSKTCTDLGGNTLSDGTTDGIFFTDIQYPVDNIYKTDRVTAVTIERRGQTMPAITLSELFTGDDWALELTFTDNGVEIDLSEVASIHAAVVSDGNIALIPSTLQSDNTTGADWETGKVIVVFNASATIGVIPARNAWIELQVTEVGGNVFTFPREQIRIVKGVIS